MELKKKPPLAQRHIILRNIVQIVAKKIRGILPLNKRKNTFKKFYFNKPVANKSLVFLWIKQYLDFFIKRVYIISPSRSNHEYMKLQINKKIQTENWSLLVVNKTVFECKKSKKPKKKNSKIKLKSPGKQRLDFLFF